jgi:Ser/Thr protein kinase RdoA (MazF antagonist)
LSVKATWQPMASGCCANGQNHVFFKHLVAGYRSEQPLSVDQLRMANTLLQLKEGFVYLILNAQLAQWATTLHLPLDTLRHAVAVMEHRMLTDAPVVDLDFTLF